jgi:aminoglycoside phosphotransferase (APT) family kinase protein
MRSPNHLAIKKQCLESIKAIVEKHQLGTLKTIRQDTEGWVNPCFFVNDEFVVRFNARDPHLPKYQRERTIYDLLRSSSIPVPQTVILDIDKDVSPYDLLISGLLPGKNLEFEWKGLDLDHKKRLAFRAGQILEKIHCVHLGYFGEIANQGPFERSSSWKATIKLRFDYLLFLSNRSHVFSDQEESLLRSIFEENLEKIADLKHASLVHGDFHFGNLLFENEEITGVVDFEWSFAGDPLYDLIFWRGANETYPESEASFLMGYGKEGFSKEEIKRMAFYQMIKNIELSTVAKCHFPKEEALSYKETSLRQASSL